MSSREIEIEDLLPLPEATFHILMAVAEDDRHGYAIIQEVATRTDGMLKLSPGTLYRSECDRREVSDRLRNSAVYHTRLLPGEVAVDVNDGAAGGGGVEGDVDADDLVELAAAPGLRRSGDAAEDAEGGV